MEREDKIYIGVIAGTVAVCTAVYSVIKHDKKLLDNIRVTFQQLDAKGVQKLNSIKAHKRIAEHRKSRKFKVCPADYYATADDESSTDEEESWYEDEDDLDDNSIDLTPSQLSEQEKERETFDESYWKAALDNLEPPEHIPQATDSLGNKIYNQQSSNKIDEELRFIEHTISNSKINNKVKNFSSDDN